MKHLSILRQAQYQEIQKLKIRGKILDLGGSQTSGYQQLIQGDHTIETVNINPDYGCDFVFDLEQPFPLKDQSYNAVLCINVLEHIYHFHHVIAESYRVLKPKGKIVVTTPFLFHVHGAPDDYFRYTASSYQKMLTEHGFEIVKVKAFGFGVASLLFQTTMAVYPEFLRDGLKQLALGVDAGLRALSQQYRNLALRLPLGYFVIARRVS